MEKDLFTLDKDDNLVVTVCLNTCLTDEDEENQDIISEYISTLPKSCDFVRVRKDTYDFSDWDWYAERGIIAYDDYDKKNILTSKPLIPLNVKDLPNEIKKLLK